MTIRLEYEIIENNKFFGGRFLGAPAPGYDEKPVGHMEWVEYLRIFADGMNN